jgi:hypothetical protein
MKWVIAGAHLRAEDVEPLAAAIPAGDLVLSGLEIADDQPLGDRDLLLRVARLRAALLERATFIAIRYGLTVQGENHGESEALAKCASYLPRWRTLLETHRNDVEMTLKVAAASPKARPDRRDFDSGAAYLRALHEAVSSAEVSDDFRAAAERAIGGVTRRWTHRDEKSMELAALVPRADVQRIREAGEALKRRFPAVPFLLSGPWPLEVFAE